MTIVVKSEIRPWRYPPQRDFQYGDWLRPEFEGSDAPWSPAIDPDLATLITMALQANRPLFGRPPDEVFDPVPHADRVRAMVSAIDGFVHDLDSGTRNVILTLARIWTTVATAVIRSKDAAADWALSHLPEEHRAVLVRARAVYVGDEMERWDDIQPQVRPHVNYVLLELNRATRPD